MSDDAKRTFTIRGTQGTETVTGLVVGAFGVHTAFRGDGVVITHLPSGCSIGAIFDDEDDALKAAQKVNDLRSDWPKLQLSDLPSLKKDVFSICFEHYGRRSGGPSPDRLEVNNLNEGVIAS